MNNKNNNDVDMTKIQNYFAKVAKKLENMPNLNQIPLKDYFALSGGTRADIQNCLDYIQSALNIAKDLGKVHDNRFNLPQFIELTDPYDLYKKKYERPSERVIDCILQNKKIDAIKEYRLQTNVGLAEAKNVVESVWEEIQNKA